MSILSGLGFSQFVNGKSKALGGIYTKAYNALIREMNDFSSTPWQRDRASAMLVRVDAIVGSLDAETRKYIEREVPAVYFTTANATKGEIRKLNITVPPSFGTIHTQAVEAAANDAMLKFGHTMVGIKRSAEEVVKFAQQKATREIIAAGQLQGEAAKTIAKEVKAKIQEDGITALVDKGGKKWQLDTYAEMLTRQVMSNSGRDGVFNTAQEYGFDLVEITSHGSQHEECAAWEGRLVSLSGKTDGYPSLEEATAAGLFHVGCKHGYFIVSNISRPKPYTPDYGAPIQEVRVGDEILNLRGGELHRVVDAKEYAYMLNTGELAPTPKGLFGHGEDDNKKFFGIDADVGKIVTSSSKFSSPSPDRYQIVVNVKDMPTLRNDPKMRGASVYVTEPIPISKIQARKL